MINLILITKNNGEQLIMITNVNLGFKSQIKTGDDPITLPLDEYEIKKRNFFAQHLFAKLDKDRDYTFDESGYKLTPEDYANYKKEIALEFQMEYYKMGKNYTKNNKLTKQAAKNLKLEIDKYFPKKEEEDILLADKKLDFNEYCKLERMREFKIGGMTLEGASISKITQAGNNTDPEYNVYFKDNQVGIYKNQAEAAGTKRLMFSYNNKLTLSNAAVKTLKVNKDYNLDAYNSSYEEIIQDNNYIKIYKAPLINSPNKEVECKYPE